MIDPRETDKQFGLRFAPERPKTWVEIRHEEKNEARIANLDRIVEILDSGETAVKIDGIRTTVPLTVGKEARLERQYHYLRRTTVGRIFPERTVEHVVASIYGRTRMPTEAMFTYAVQQVRARG